MFLGWKSQATGSTAGSGWRRGSSLGSTSAQATIELIEMLRCPEEHGEEFLVLSTSEMNGRMVWLGVGGGPVCHRDFEIIDGVVDFTEVVKGKRQTRAVRRTPAPAAPVVLDAESLQALLAPGGPGGGVVPLGAA